MWRNRSTLCLYAIPLVCLAILFSGPRSLPAAEVDMAEVRRLAKEPVETILEGSPVEIINKNTYWDRVRKSSKPVTVMFYTSKDQKSRDAATLFRYLALDFHQAIHFYGYKVADNTPVERQILKQLNESYSLDKVPGTFFYDNDKGNMELEKEDYSVPLLKEYRTPGRLLWKTYYKYVTKYIRENILD